jgi:outer membrane receptor protein involved in Fe transport
MKRLQFCLVVFAVLALTFSAFAQVENSQFTGTVLDPTGAAIATAKVTVTNSATDLHLSATSNSSGNYTIREVPPGVYKITVEAAGFKTVSNNAVTANAGTIAHVDFKLQIGKASEVVEVTGEATAINTEDSKLSSTVTATQIQNLPLNGRNVYDLIQMVPGAVNVTGVDMENGHNTVVNGVREDFNGFLINGVSNKDLSGGVNNVPIEDTVEEFQQLQLNVSAQYGSSAGSINNLITKSGSNAIHGTAWDYVRNDMFDANNYFLNQQGVGKLPVRFNQYGFTVGGPIVKDKLFFFGSFQKDHFQSAGTPETLTVESPAWEQAVISGQPNSVAALIYQNFPPKIPGTPAVSIQQKFGDGSLPNSNPNLGPANAADTLCDQSYPAPYDGSAGPGIGDKLIPILGVTAPEIASMNAMGCLNTPAAPVLGTIGDRSASGAGGSAAAFQNSTVAVFGTQTQSLGNLFNGIEGSGRIDYTPNSNNRFFAQFNWLHETDQYGPCYSYCTRGFTNPADNHFPNGQLSWVHTFSPKVLNEFRAGYTQNNTGTSVALPGVPSIAFSDGTAAIGSYNGYPQFFKDHEYSYSDMVSISHGNHSFKVGFDLRRNLENSQFNVARASYYFIDPAYFAADAPGYEIAGVNPGFVNGGTGQGALDTNIRHWRNWEIGSFFQDDWKASKRLTLNLGLRWDLYTRHTEEDNLATTFILGPPNASIPGIAGQIADANVPFSSTLGPGGSDGYTTTCNPGTVAIPSSQILAGVCGPGGFAPASRLGPNKYKDFGPRVGFAWDVFGDGKTSLRGGFGVSYEGTLYNPLSNSRWNPPYYSFNEIFNPIFGGTGTTVYGPETCAATSPGPGLGCTSTGAAPTYLGHPGNVGQSGFPSGGAENTGNITGYAPFNQDKAYLTGIVFPKGIDDPYIYNFFLSVQREVIPKLVVEADYVGTAGHKLFRAEDTDRVAGGVLPVGSSVVDNLGRTLVGLNAGGGGTPNPNYGIMRTWENSVNSNYNALQLSAKKQMSHGILFNANYTWSHSIDDGSTWHSGATTANGGAAGEGYTTDQTLPGLDRGNSIYDIRHRVVLNYVIQLPGQSLKGALGAIAGGWSYNGIWAFQSGAHWMPYAGNGDPANLEEINGVGGNPPGPCTAADVNGGNCTNLGGDFNLDTGNNDRPNSSIQHATFSRNTWANGWCNGSGYTPPAGSNTSGGCAGTATAGNLPTLSAPCLGCTGDLGRNNFLGPGQWYADMTLGKTFNLTERFHLKFEAQGFNVFNRANFLLAVNGGGAHNTITSGELGQAAGTLNARNIQLGLKLLF